MKSILLAAGLIAFTFSPVLAEETTYQREHGHVGVQDGAKESQFCPVCGPEEKMESLAFAYKHEGKKYRFCSLDCMKAFKKSPKQFIAKPEAGK